MCKINKILCKACCNLATGRNVRAASSCMDTVSAEHCMDFLHVSTSDHLTNTRAIVINIYIYIYIYTVTLCRQRQSCQVNDKGLKLSTSVHNGHSFITRNQVLLYLKNVHVILGSFLLSLKSFICIDNFIL